MNSLNTHSTIQKILISHDELTQQQKRCLSGLYRAVQARSKSLCFERAFKPRRTTNQKWFQNSVTARTPQCAQSVFIQEKSQFFTKGDFSECSKTFAK